MYKLNISFTSFSQMKFWRQFIWKLNYFSSTRWKLVGERKIKWRMKMLFARKKKWNLNKLICSFYDFTLLEKMISSDVLHNKTSCCNFDLERNVSRRNGKWRENRKRNISRYNCIMKNFISHPVRSSKKLTSQIVINWWEPKNVTKIIPKTW